MATRTISTKLEIEGEASYKQSITSVNSTLKNLRSELGLVQAQYQNHQNSLAALTAKEQALSSVHAAQSEKLKTLKEYLQSAQASQSKYAAQMDTLKTSLATLNSSLAAMDPKVVAAGKSWAGYAQEAAKTEAELKTLQGSTGDTSARQAELTAKLAETRAKMADLETATGGAAKEAGQMVLQQQQLQTQLAQSEAAYDRSTRAVNNLQTQTNNAQRDLYHTEAELEQTRKYLDEAKTSADGCATSIDEFGKQAKQSGEDAQDAFGDLKNALAALGIAKAVKEISAALNECVEAADAFEYQMGYVETLADTSSTAWSRLEGDILDLSNAYGVAATELSGAAYQALSAGVATADAAEFLETATKLSVAGMTSTTSAVDLLTNAINVYGLSAADAAHISDGLLQVQNLGKTTINDLASVYSVAATQAAAFDVSIENLNTGFAVLTKNGIATANAGTFLSSMFTELADEGSAVAITLKEKTGLSFQQLNEAGYTLGDTMQILLDSVDGNSTSFSNLWSNVRAGRAALNIAQTGAEEYNRVLGKISSSAGLTAQSYDILADTGTTAANRMKESWTNLEIALGDTVAPAVAELNNGLADLFTGAAGIIEQCPVLGSAVVAVVEGVKVFAASIGFITAVSIPSLKAALVSLGKTMTTTPIGPLVIGFSALSAAAVFLATTFAGTESELAQYTDAVEELTDAVEESKAAFDEGTEEIGRSAEENRALMSSLEDLLAVEDKSAAQKARITSIVESLNGSVEGLTLSYDEQTDALNMTTDAVYDCINAQEKQASNAAKLERLAEIEEQRASPAALLAEAEAKVAEEGEYLNRTLEQTGSVSPYDPHIASLRKYSETMGDLMAQDEALAAETEELSSAVDEYAQAQENAAEVSQSVLNAMEDLDKAYQDAYESARASLSGQFSLWEEVGEVSEKSASDLKKALDSQIEYWQDYGTNRDAVLSRGIDGMDAYVSAIDDGSADAAAILAGLADATDEELADIAASYQELQDAQDDLAGNMADTATNYTASMERLRLDTSKATSDIASYFADLRVKAPNLVSGLPAAVNSALAGSSARAQYSGAGTTVGTSFADAVKSQRSAASSAGSALGSSAISGLKNTATYDEGYRTGTNAANGFIDALTTKQAKAKAAGSGIGSSALSGVKYSLKINSPSRAMGEMADFTMDGFVGRIRDRLPDSVQAMKEAAESSYQAFSAGLIRAERIAADRGLADGRSLVGQGGRTVNLGGVNITVNAAPGQNAREIADVVIRRIQHQVSQRGAAF